MKEAIHLTFPTNQSKYIKYLDPTATDCNQVFSAEDNDAESCVKSLCSFSDYFLNDLSLAVTNTSVLATLDSNIISEAEKQFNKNVLPKIEKYTDVIESGRTLVLKEATKRIKNKTWIPTNLSKQKMYYSLLSRDLFTPYFYFEYDSRLKEIKVTSGYKDGLPDVALAEFGRYKDEVRKKTNVLLKQYNCLSKCDKEQAKKIVNDLLKADGLDTRARDALSGLKSQLENFEIDNIYNELLSAIIQIPLNNFCTNNVCQSTLNKALQDHINKENELIKKKRLFKRLMAHQKAIHLMNVANHSCSKDDLNGILQRSKEKFLNYFSNRLSEHTSRVIRDYFNNGIVMKLNTDLDYGVSFNIEEDHNVNDVQSNDMSRFTSDLMLDALLPQVNLEEFLSITFVPLVSDFISPQTSKGKVELAISPFSCANPKLGEQITGHELAHAVSFLFMSPGRSEESFNKFLNVRNKCVNSFYQTPILKPGYPDFHKDDQFRSEEDMADLIQGLLYNDEKNLLLSCALLKPNPNTRKMDLSLENQKSDDPHSAPFLRLLREAVYKNINLPPSCKKIITENSNTYRLKKCTF